MDISTLSSTLIRIPNKPFNCLPLSRNWQRLHSVVSCRATKKLASDEEDTTINGNFYKVLSLSPKSATVDEIKKAYRSMALRYHPDVCQDPSMKEEWTRMFVQVNAAYETLSNPVLREEYDCELGLIRRSCRRRRTDGERWRSRWQEQVVELKRRSNRKMAQKGGGSSWGSRMRDQNMENQN